VERHPERTIAWRELGKMGEPDPRRSDAGFVAKRLRAMRMTAPPLQAAFRAALVPLILIAAAACLMIGLSRPIMHVRWLVVFDAPVSVLGGIRALLDNGDLLLAVVLFAFSVAFPLLEIVLLLAIWLTLRRGRRPPAGLLAILQGLGRWSMLDVFVLALVIFAIKAQPLADARTAEALLPFLAAIALTAYGANVVKRACG
jgi:paraquat-inducible protein A